MPGIYQKQFQDENAAREFLEKLFWPDGPVCPKCGVIGDATKLERKEGTKSHGRKGLYQCNRVGCREQFTVTIGTILEDSHIALHKWLLAIYLMCSSKKGISALQLQRNLELGSYRTAWFMARRIRWAMTQGPMTELLKGIVEVDDTYVGGRLKQPKRGSDQLSPQSNKTPVLALVERRGNVRSFPLERATLKNIKPIMQQHIDPSSHLVTDEFPYYYMRTDFPKLPYDQSLQERVLSQRGRHDGHDQYGRFVLRVAEAQQLRDPQPYEPQIYGSYCLPPTCRVQGHRRAELSRKPRRSADAARSNAGN